MLVAVQGAVQGCSSGFVKPKAEERPDHALQSIRSSGDADSASFGVGRPRDKNNMVKNVIAWNTQLFDTSLEGQWEAKA